MTTSNFWEGTRLLLLQPNRGKLQAEFSERLVHNSGQTSRIQQPKPQYLVI